MKQYSCIIAGFISCPELTSLIYSNYEYWKEKLAEEEKTGIRLCYKSSIVALSSTAPSIGSGNVAVSGGVSSSSSGGGGSGGISGDRPTRLHTVQELGSDDQQTPSTPGSGDMLPLKSTAAATSVTSTINATNVTTTTGGVKLSDGGDNNAAAAATASICDDLSSPTSALLAGADTDGCTS